MAVILGYCSGGSYRPRRQAVALAVYLVACSVRPGVRKCLLDFLLYKNTLKLNRYGFSILLCLAWPQEFFELTDPTSEGRKAKKLQLYFGTHMEINISVEKKGEWDQVVYAGPINEDSEVALNPVLSQIGKNVIFNFKSVEYVNSCGVRAWINFLREAETGRSVIFEECTPEIVSQINMIPNFKGQAKIKSVYASYACDNCGHQGWELYEEGRNLPESPTDGVDEVACSQCGSEMEMEELEDEFFAWLDVG